MNKIKTENKQIVEISKKSFCTEYTALKMLNALEDMVGTLKRIEEKLNKSNI